MPNVLVISRHYPPLSSAGASIRLVKFIKYLSPLGWNFVVFTQDIDQPVVPEMRLSAFLLEEIPEETIIIRVPAQYPSSEQSTITRSNFLIKYISRLIYRLLPDTSLIWGLRVLRQALRYIRDRKVDIIFATAPVFTNALIGGLLSRLTDTPFFLDLKDDWVDSPRYWQKPRWRQIVEKHLERLIINSSAGVSLVTESSYQHYVDRYKNLQHPVKFHYIPNGCDLDEYLCVKDNPVMPQTGCFTIISAAWGYHKDYRDAAPFLHAVARFINQYPMHRQQIRIVFLGDSLSEEYYDMIVALGIEDNIERVGPVVRDDMANWLRQAELFFLVQPVGNTTAISGTLYEYWATGKAPILLISDEGASTELIRKHNLGRSFHYDDIDGVTRYMIDVYEHYLRQDPMGISSEGVESYDRKLIALKMAEIWQQSLTPEGFTQLQPPTESSAR